MASGEMAHIAACCPALECAWMSWGFLQCISNQTCNRGQISGPRLQYKLCSKVQPHHDGAHRSCKRCKQLPALLQRAKMAGARDFATRPSPHLAEQEGGRAEVNPPSNSRCITTR